jgi:aromatic-L-amino-acid/L-tryptophan decarboxylase
MAAHVRAKGVARQARLVTAWSRAFVYFQKMSQSTGQASSYHMTPDEFRQKAEAVIDCLVRYQQHVAQFPVMSQVRPGQVRATLPARPPQQGEPFEQVLRDMETKIMPGVTHWQSPNFYAYFPSNNSGPSILGDLLSSGIGVQGMLWATSPACTELETLVLDWLVEMLGLPPAFLSTSKGGGVIQDTASSATLCALLAARERATNFRTNEDGCDGSLVAYTSEHAHSSLEKNVKIAGIGSRNLRLIGVDENFALRADLLEQQIKKDIGAGKKPFFVMATVGTTSSNAIDPVRSIGEICQKHGLWLHVDSAMAGTAALCPEFRFIHDGVELADSYVFNPHKWMFTNFDCSVFYVADRKTLIETLSVLPEYLKNQATEAGAVFDYRDWHIPLGRRFRALKLWLVIRHYGVQGLQHHIREHVRIAQELLSWVKAESRFEVMAPAPLNLVCFRLRGEDDSNQRLMDALNRSGKLYLSHTKLNGRFTLRMCVGQALTQEHHVRAAWELIRQTAATL